MRTAKIKEKYHIEYHRFIIFEKTPRKPTQNVQSWIINGAVSTDVLVKMQNIIFKNIPEI